MGQILKKQYSMPAPKGAVVIEQSGVKIARWKLRNGQSRSAEVVATADGRLRVRGESRYYVARYRNGDGQVVEVATGCRDEGSARALLVKLERQAELIRSGVVTEAEVDAGEHAQLPTTKHVEAYRRHLHAKGGNDRRIGMLEQRLLRLIRECKFSTLQRIKPGPLEDWLVEQADAGLSSSARNCYRESAIGFCNWARRTKRMTTNPLVDVARADANADRRHHRRAFTESELTRLFAAAELRPLAEFGREVVHEQKATNAPASRATWSRKPLAFEDLNAAVDRARNALDDNPDFVSKLEWEGRERALIYRTLFNTGLRRSELAAIRIADLDFSRPVAYAILDAKHEKNRKGSEIPLRADLAEAIKVWLADKLVQLQAECRRDGLPIPTRIPGTAPLFDMPSGLNRIFDRDLAAANISKRDERDRVVDVHSLRVSLASHLCASGVPLRTAQAAMRHSKPELTARVYVDIKLLDVAGALNTLPAIAQTPTAATQNDALHAPVNATQRRVARSAPQTPPTAPRVVNASA